MSLAQRSTTAFFFVIVMLAGIFGGEIPFTILFTLICGLCSWEFFGLMMKDRQGALLKKMAGVLLSVCPFLLLALQQLGFIEALSFVHLSSIWVLGFSILFLMELFTINDQPFQDMGAIALSFFYIGASFALLTFVAWQDGVYQPIVVFGLLLLSWTNDTGAYLLGSKIGKTKLFPRISPKKTWEGSISGVVGTLLMAYVLYKFTGTMNLQDWLAFAVIVAIFGSLGDLVESMMKRSLGIKDSGNFLPGHGGFLDRFDAFIFLVPFAAFYMIWF